MNSFSFNLSDLLTIFSPVINLIRELFFSVKIYGIPLIYYLLCVFIFSLILGIVTHIHVPSITFRSRRSFSDYNKSDAIKQRYTIDN